MLCVQIANQLVSNVLFYMLHIYLGEFSFLGKLDNQVHQFIWSGRGSEQEENKKPRLDHTILSRPLDEGGLGVIFSRNKQSLLQGRECCGLFLMEIVPFRLYIE